MTIKEKFQASTKLKINKWLLLFTFLFSQFTLISTSNARSFKGSQCSSILQENSIARYDANRSSKIEAALERYPGFSFFREDRPATFDLDEFIFNRSYTVIVDNRTKEIFLGANIQTNFYTSIKSLLPFIRGQKQYSGTHMALKTMIENEKGDVLSPETTFGGSIKFTQDGDIEVSGFASQQPNPEGLAVIVNIMKDIFPDAIITATPYRLSEISNPRRSRGVTIHHLQREDRGLRYSNRFRYWQIFR